MAGPKQLSGDVAVDQREIEHVDDQGLELRCRTAHVDDDVTQVRATEKAPGRRTNAGEFLGIDRAALACGEECTKEWILQIELLSALRDSRQIPADEFLPVHGLIELRGGRKVTK